MIRALGGWGPWIRTTIDGSRDRCPAIRRVPNFTGEILPSAVSFVKYAKILSNAMEDINRIFDANQ